ncbi:MAG: hypothetical protein C4334_15140 [Pyrinomonas sp.]|uniref:DUF402 domain-containing protein n=1 Tax=Pyrinomonas sp. TaxID=2080306 RepID=UPI00332D59B9
MNAITVRSFKYNGQPHRSWPATLRQRSGTLITLDAVFQEPIAHPLIGHIPQGTLSTEFYWTDRWYSVFRFAAPDGALRCFYGNINLPVDFDGTTLRFVDLDIDLLVTPDYACHVLDLDEFQTNARRYGYPPELRRTCLQALRELMALARARRFPFDT